MTLRTRINQRIADLHAERAIAEKAISYDEEISSAWVTTVELGHETLIHAMRQGPATTIARIDRELAGCAADLTLLDRIDPPRGFLLSGDQLAIKHNLNARYPSEES